MTDEAVVPMPYVQLLDDAMPGRLAWFWQAAGSNGRSMDAVDDEGSPC